MRELVRGRADLDKPRRNGATPLYTAASRRRQVSQADQNGRYNGREDAVRVLVEARADLDRPTTSGRGITPLRAAIAARHRAIAAYLHEQGAQEGVQGRAGTAVFHAPNRAHRCVHPLGQALLRPAARTTGHRQVMAELAQ